MCGADKMSLKRIENLTIPMFNLNGRKEVKNLKKVRFYCQGLILSSNSIQEKEKFEREVIISKDIKVENQKPLEACINLGEYLEKNPKIIRDIASNYVRYINLNRIRYEMACRFDFDLTTYQIESITDNFNSFSINNYLDVDILSKKPMKIGSYKDNTLIRRITKFFKYCGISDKDCFNLKEELLIPTVSILHIFDFCIEVYRDFNKLQNGELDVDININLHVTFPNGNPKAEKRVTNLKSMIYLTMISFYKGKSIGHCLYCNDLYFGRKNQKFCCPNCSDLYNGKYERRKERKLNDKNISQK